MPGGNSSLILFSLLEFKVVNIELSFDSCYLYQMFWDCEVFLICSLFSFLLIVRVILRKSPTVINVTIYEMLVQERKKNLNMLSRITIFFKDLYIFDMYGWCNSSGLWISLRNKHQWCIKHDRNIRAAIMHFSLCVSLSFF